LSVARDRLYGLRCAINGAQIASNADRAGLLRLVEDLVEALTHLCAQYAADHAISAPRSREADFPPKRA
jgi:hypothetical protein